MKSNERTVRHKFGLTISEKKKKKHYEKGEQLTESGIIFLEEVEPELRKKDKDSIYLMAIRKAKFQCYCGKEFVNKITLIKNGRVVSCGCERVRKIKEMLDSKRQPTKS